MEHEPHIVQLTEQIAAVVSGVVATSEMAPFFDRSFGLLAAAIASQAVEVTGPAFAYYRNAPTDVADLAVGFPTSRPIAADGEVQPFTLPTGSAATAVHAGGYDQLGEAWGTLIAWTRSTDFTPAGPMWEVYVTEPSPDMDPDDLLTELVLPGTPRAEP